MSVFIFLLKMKGAKSIEELKKMRDSERRQYQLKVAMNHIYEGVTSTSTTLNDPSADPFDKKSVW
jgi:hypothetical protein